MKPRILQRTAERSRKETPSRRRLLSRVLVLAAVLLVGAAAGAALTLLFLDRPAPEPAGEPTAGYYQPPADDSAEAGFARDMVVHHAQAVEMAEILRARTQSEEIRTLAADITLSQQSQIGQMQGWLAAWGLPATSQGPAMSWMGAPMEGRMPGMASPEDIDALYKASPEEADVRFLQLMIPHHQAAVPMAEAILERTNRPEVRQLAQAIVASQQAEIKLMQNMLQNRGVSSSVGGETVPAQAGSD
ncbi:MAG TPA: DUF305 domain-containing protein [Rubrobacteraceae bacterium]|jgi:uncharacterized protein (DUF305 family)|nr:DUF305 domain-containing protein [Rubrobacteraceae bacterium]